jgi:FixJ family two-component response regulator
MDRVIPQMTVFVVDDDPELRHALEGLLQSVGLRADGFSSTDEFLQGFNPKGPCCLILDVRLRNGSGLQFLTELRRIAVKIPVIIITAYGDIPMAVRAIKDGAIAFLPKPFREQDLLDAVREGLDEDTVRRDASRRLLDLQARYDSLTPREQMVMTLICVGLMNKQVAGRLGITVATVKVHRHNVMKKLNAKSLPELVRMAKRLQIRE